MLFFVGICNLGYYPRNLSTSTVVCSSVLCLVEIKIKNQRYKLWNKQLN